MLCTWQVVHMKCVVYRVSNSRTEQNITEHNRTLLCLLQIKFRYSQFKIYQWAPNKLAGTVWNAKDLTGDHWVIHSSSGLFSVWELHGFTIKTPFQCTMRAILMQLRWFPLVQRSKHYVLCTYPCRHPGFVVGGCLRDINFNFGGEVILRFTYIHSTMYMEYCRYLQ